MMKGFRVTLVCPLPRKGFGKSERRCDDEIVQMERYLKEASGQINVFPEGYIPADRTGEVEALAKRYKRWIICGSEDQGEKKSLYTLVISAEEGVIQKHMKTALTEGDRNNHAEEGKDISAVDTPFGKIGVILCYEMHFPEVARILGIEGAQVMINTIGTGMWHEQQFDEWTTLAKARAIENRCFTLGTTHFCDPIPMMYAYDPHGKQLGLKRNFEGIMEIDIDPDLIDERDYFRDRNPEAYTKICQK